MKKEDLREASQEIRILTNEIERRKRTTPKSVEFVSTGKKKKKEQETMITRNFECGPSTTKI